MFTEKFSWLSRRSVSLVPLAFAVGSGTALGRDADTTSSVVPLAAQPAQLAKVRDVTPDLAAVKADPGSPGGFVFLSPQSVLVTSGRAGFHRSDNRGNRWVRAMNGFVDETGVEPFAVSLCQAPSAPSIVYGIGAGFNTPALEDRMYRSDNFGETWKRGGAIGDAASVIDCAVDPQDADTVYAVADIADAAGRAVVSKSTDGAETFTTIGAGLDSFVVSAPRIRVSKTRPATVYIVDVARSDLDVDRARLFVSSDAGLNFQAVVTAEPLAPTGLFLHPTVDGRLFVTSKRGVLRSEDHAESFERIPGLPDTAEHLAFDPANVSVLYVAAALEGVFRSVDGGINFTRLQGPAADQFGPSRTGPEPNGVYTIEVGTAGKRREPSIYIATALGPHRSDDGGTTYRSILHNYRGAAANDLTVDAEGRLIVGVFHTVAAVRATTPGAPKEYERIGEGIGDQYGFAVAASSHDPNVLLVSTAQSGIQRTGDGGVTWVRSQAVDLPGTFMAFAPGDDSRAYLTFPGGGSGGLHRSDDGGATFRQVSVDGLRTVAVDPRDPDVLYAASVGISAGIFKSTDGGETLNHLGPLGNYSRLAIDPINPETVYAANRAGGVLRSTDGGATWTDINQGLPDRPVLDIGIDPQAHLRLFAWIQREGLFRSDNGGNEWYAVETDEALRRSANSAGRATLVVDPIRPGRVYLPNSGVIQIDTKRKSK